MATIAATVERRKWLGFSQPAQLLYVIVIVEFIGSVGLALSFGFRTASITAFLPQMYCVLLIVCGPLLRRLAWDRTAEAFETVGFLYGQGFALVALLYPMTAISWPFADAQLAAVDRAIGFDWPVFAARIRDHELLLRVMKATYFSFGWQGGLILVSLYFAKRLSRAWRLVFAANLALVLTLLIYPFLPAAGTFIHFGITPANYPNMTSQVAWSFGPAIEAIRDHHARFITRALMVPFVSFPSYHATAALLFAWAAWPVRIIRWWIVLLNALMVVSALIYGAHYLVDLVGGSIIAIIGIVVANKLLSVIRVND